jgi:integrase
MQWRDVDLSTGWWLIRAEDAKNSDAHRVALTALALEIITRRRGSAGAGDQYVFSNHAGSCVADRAKKAASELCRGLSFQFRAHDIRRTVASYMGEAGLDRFHIALVLNHRSVTHNSVTAIYDRYRYDREKRLALETWSDVLQSIVKPEQPGSIRRSE